jgi:hypothetical protein
MWPFTTRGSRSSTQAYKPRDFPVFQDFAISDAKLKVWLPEYLVDRIAWLSFQKDASKPDVARALLFEHLYGWAAYEELQVHFAETRKLHAITQARNSNGFGDRLDIQLHGRNEEQVQFSVRDTTKIDLSYIGKSDWDFTFTMPKQMLKDLGIVASLHGITPSHCMRKILVLQLQGELVHARWQSALGAISRDVAKLELDQS